MTDERQGQQAVTARETVIVRARAERRRYKRVRVDLAGRLFVPGDGREARCEIVDMSPGSAAIRCEMIPGAETPVVLYVDGFGRFEGAVVRIFDDCFAVRFSCSALKRERIAEQLIVHLNRTLVGDTEVRRHERTPTQALTRFTRADGNIVPCEVLDLSLSGVSLKSDLKPPLGEFVLIGQMAGRVARHHETGIGIEFVGVPQDRAAERPPLRIAAVR
jgi:hypothetical protein